MEKEDIEGLIAAGAPSDEYSSEASGLYEVLNNLPPEKVDNFFVEEVIFKLWEKNFDLSEEDLGLRMPSIKKVAAAIVDIVKHDKFER